MMPAPHTWGEGDVPRITDAVKLIVLLSAVLVHLFKFGKHAAGVLLVIWYRKNISQYVSACLKNIR